MKKVVIGLVVLLLLCCCCSTIVGLGLLFVSPSGYVELNGQCARKGVDAHPTTGPCADKPDVSAPAPQPTPTQVPPTGSLTDYDTGRYSDIYTFSYPKSFILDDAVTRTYVYSQDPKSVASGDFNDNLSVTTVESSSFDVTQANCDDYTMGLLEGLTTEINVNRASVKTNATSIGGFDACSVTYDATYKGFNLKQEQYVVPDAYFDASYIITVSLKKDSINAGAFTSIVNSFQIY